MKLNTFSLTRMDNPLVEVSKMAFKEGAKQTEQILLTQLNELIKRGLLVVEETQPLLCRSFHHADQATIEVRMEKGVRLVLKDQEYVESLEQKILDLEAQLLEKTEKLDKITVAIETLK